MSKKVYFVSGIDTDAGKSYATGYIARSMIDKGEKVITQKLIQTGCPTGDYSEDISLHRRIMGVELQPQDLDRTTCPISFTYPASPDLAARIDGRKIDLGLADAATEKLLDSYDVVLIEGAGGLLVPIEGDYTMADYVVERGLSLMLVTNPKLGSVNHTLLSLELCRSRGIELVSLVYNHYPQESEIITDDTRSYLKRYLLRYHPKSDFVEVPYISSVQ